MSVSSWGMLAFANNLTVSPYVTARYNVVLSANFHLNRIIASTATTREAIGIDEDIHLSDSPPPDLVVPSVKTSALRSDR